MLTPSMPVTLAVASMAAPAPVDTQDAAIQTLIGNLVSAWNTHDAKAFSERFMEDGSFANILGMTSFTKAGFERQHEHIFTTIYRDSHLAITVDRVKMLRPDVALVSTTTLLSGYSQLPAGMTPAADGALHTKLEMVLLKQADGWWIASFHNVAVGAGMPPEPPR